MNAKDLAQKIQKPEPTIAAAVRSMQKNPDDFDEATGDRVAAILTGTTKDQPKQIGGGTSAKKAETNAAPSSVDAALKNSRLAEQAITAEQVAALLQEAEEQGYVVGSLMAVKFYLGLAQGQAQTKADLFRLHESKNSGFWDSIVGKNESAMLEGEVLASAYQQNQETPPQKLLKDWKTRNQLAPAYEND